MEKKPQGQLFVILNSHKMWLSDKTRGKQADLTNIDLRETELQGRDLTGAKGFSLKQLAGANIAGITLPEGTKDDLYKSLDRVAEASQNARKIFQLMLLGCIYSLLTIATSTDVALLTNSGSSPLPVIGARVPIVWFYLAAPIVLLSVFVYLHIYLQRLWEEVSCQPAIFPDGKRLDEKVYPWLLNGLACSQFKYLQGHRPPLSMLQQYIYRFFTWWFVPATLVLFWWRHLVRHDWLFTGIHLVLLLASICGATVFYRLFTATFQKEITFSWVRNNWKSVLIRPRYLLTLALFPVLSILAIHNPYPKYLGVLYSWTTVDFVETDVSTKPENWTGEDDAEIKLVKGARLKGANLKGANAYRAFLVKADLRGANLKRADLRAVDLREAKLQNAQLQETKMRNAKLQNSQLQKAGLQSAYLQNTKLQGANLQEAKLYKTRLQDAKLQDAKMQNAQLQRANLQRANLSKADLTKADLYSANLKQAVLQEVILIGASLKQANLQEADLSKSKLNKANLEKATLWGANLKQTTLSEANLQEADIRDAEMQGVELWRANLQGANLQGTNLEGATMEGVHLEGADLSKATGLNKEQLKSAHIDNKTKLPDYLQEETHTAQKTQ